MFACLIFSYYWCFVLNGPSRNLSDRHAIFTENRFGIDKRGFSTTATQQLLVIDIFYQLPIINYLEIISA